MIRHCRKTGVITLLNRSGEVIDTKRYKGFYERNEIEKGWWAIYSRGMCGCCLQIAPDIYEEKADYDFVPGQAKKKYKLPTVAGPGEYFRTGMGGKTGFGTRKGNLI